MPAEPNGLTCWFIALELFHMDDIKQKIIMARRKCNNAEEIELLRIHLQRNPDDGLRLLDLADALRAVGRSEEAQTLLRSLPDRLNAGRYSPALALGVLHQQKCMPDEAERWFRKAAELNPGTSGTWALMGIFYMSVGRPEMARAAFERGLQTKEDVDEAHVNLGNYHRAVADYSTACDRYREALRINPEYPGAEHDLRDCEAALRVRAPFQMEDIEQKIVFARRNGNRAEGIELLQVHLRQNPDDDPRRLQLAKNLRDLGRTVEAEKLLLSLPDRLLGEKYPPALSLGRLYQARCMRGEAERCFRKAAELEPGTTGTWVYLGIFYMLVGQLEMARATFERGLQAKGDIDEVYINLGNYYRAVADYATACDHYREGLKIDPEYPDAQHDLRDCEAALAVVEATGGRGGRNGRRMA